MRSLPVRSWVAFATCVAATLGACSGRGGDATPSTPAADGGTTSSSGGSSNGGSSSGIGTSNDGGSVASGGDGGAPGNPGACTGGVPAAGALADTSHPTTVVGTGTAASCTYDALTAAVAKGGVITFDCGGAPVAISVSSTLNVPIGVDTVIDGGGLVTLDGGGGARILSLNSPNWQSNTHRLTLQRLTLTGGKATPTDAIPTAPAPCSQGWDDGQGGAVYVRDGNLTVVDCTFTNNQAAPLGPDTGGGAIYVQGSLQGVLAVRSTFTGNRASNGGAIGGLFAELDVYESVFRGNQAVGKDANNDIPCPDAGPNGSCCEAMNNGQNEVGSGGNGGALYSDGNSVNVVLCGDDIEDDAAGVNAFGGGLFFTSDNLQGTLTITDTTMTGNTGGSWTNVSTGSVTNAGTAIGVNAKSISITGSALQGYP